MSTFADIKSKARLPEKLVPLYLGSLQAEFEDLERQLDEERAKPNPGTLASAGRTPEEIKLAEAIEDLRQEMQADVTVFRLRALPKGKWTSLMAKHPPRTEDREEGNAYNMETGPIAAVAACCVDPQMSVPEVEELVDEMLTQGQWDALWSTVFYLNRRKFDVPSSVAASEILRSSKRS
ncbi:hypothetical protein OIE13_22300 [Streptosporangium sp. NBC_01810]|uniref:hypothetical protein n=1 Tax=Streptosporangium sp. NBC_01810 TaxID=2975951 RepID=UPI002DD7BAD9|nr:hypothetical protein [Streptosporangium sp. NBC_01810]WSA23675.1 hypothetical protein OIE13_22300 [Streptosporangium sp. NBC_01810]